MNPVVYQTIIDSLVQAQSVEEIHSVCTQITQELGFDHFIFGARLPTSFVKPYLSIVSGFPDEWWDRYKSQNYIRIDPTVAHCASKTTPLPWTALAPLEKENRQISQFMIEARDFKLRSGASFPVHSPQGETGMLSLVSDETAEKAQARINKILPYAHLLTVYIHEAVRKVLDVREIRPQTVHLTEREQECLLWAAEGKTSWEISQILKISERTVIFHLQNATAKLGVNNRQQAIARAVSMGLIVPQLS